MQASRGELKGTRRLPGKKLETAVLQIHMNPNRVAAQFTQGFRLRDPRPALVGTGGSGILAI